MRNLRLLCECHTSLNFEKANPGYCWLTTDSANETVITGNSEECFVRKQNKHFKRGWHDLTRQAFPPDLGHVIGGEFLVVEDALFLATFEGTLALCWDKEVSIVGEVAGGISAFRWSPDQEILVFTTGDAPHAAHLSVLTADWKPVATQPLEPADFGEQKPVTIGWGKKETQFHGTEGKQAAQMKTQEFAAVSETDDLIPRISFRGDGQYFAVNSVSAAKVRSIRVYDRQGVLQSTSEDVSGLEWSLSWKPSGALIASSVVSASKREIVFFEMNGLRHGEFTLPFPVERSNVREIQWNLSSEILLVWVVSKEKDNLIVDYLLLWTVSNFHWYLKQVLPFPRAHPQKVLAACAWSHRNPFWLHMRDSGGTLTLQEWKWEIARSDDISSSVAVIDGSSVLLTNFAFGIVPPPSSSHKLVFEDFVDQVVFCSSDDFYELAVVTHRRNVLIFYSSRSSPALPPVLRKICSVPFSYRPVVFWYGKESLAVIEPSRIENMDVWGMWTFSVKHESQRELEDLVSMEFLESDKTCRNISYFESPIVDFSSVDSTSFVTTIAGQTTKAVEHRDGFDISEYMKFTPACHEIFVQFLGKDAVIYALNLESHKLYRSKDLVNDCCTSFVVLDDFLLFTTYHHKLISISLRTEGFGILRDEREVERGSRIVIAVKNGTEVILQLPRGNLETIHPRALVIAKICRFLKEKAYADAFSLARKHRLNLNILVDVDYENFVGNTVKFVEQLQDPSDLNIFIAELSDENVTKTVYANHFAQPPLSVPNKRNCILRALEKVFPSVPLKLSILPRLACHIYKVPKDLEAALCEIMELRNNPSSPVSAEEALKFVLYSADIDELFNIALGTYDFDLVLMVASKSRKDPKEYIPFLNQFRQLTPVARQHFAIDKYLKRFSKALNHLASLGPDKFQECVDLVVEHQLYSDSLAIFPADGPERRRLLYLYGEYLGKKRRKFYEAGVAFGKGRHYDEAVECFKMSLDWQLAMSYAKEANWNKQKVSKTAETISLGLKGASRYKEAGILLLDFAENMTGAFDAFITGHCWQDAHLLHQRFEDTGQSVQTKMLSALKKSCQDLVAQIAVMEESFEKYRVRLSIVQRQKRERREVDADDDNLEVMSETSSVSEKSGSSRSSRISKGSSKSRKKDEKKKRSLREGGPYEDLALLDTLKSLYRQADAMVKEVEALLKMLSIYELKDDGRELQERFGLLLIELRDKRMEIWTSEALMATLNPRPGGYMYGPSATVNMIAAAADLQAAGDGSIGNVSMSDLVLFIPPELNMTYWNECKMDLFDL